VTPTDIDLRDRSVLVTGGTGFIGGRLAERLVLDHGARVRVLVRDPSRALRLARLPIEVVIGDLTDASAVHDAVRGCEIVLHCAHDSGSIRRHRASAVDGAVAIAAAVQAAGCHRFVHLSTYAVYGPTEDGDLDESSPWHSSSHPYVKAKRAAEDLLRAHHRDVGLPVVILQPTIVYGPYGGVWTTGVLDLLRQGLVPLPEGGGGLCNAVYVDDVVDAILLAATRPGVEGETLLVSAREPVSWERFYGAFADILGVRGTVPMAEPTLRSLARSQRRRVRRRIGRELVSLFGAWVRLPSTRALLDDPGIRPVVQVLRRALPERRMEALKAWTSSSGGQQALPVEAGGARDVHVPEQLVRDLHRARTRVRVERARDVLGYEPRFDFATGMALTRRWAEWARLS
jgi:nucleoside-diphosphate-sugar epimerase